jgi:hypothetical protein
MKQRYAPAEQLRAQLPAPANVPIAGTGAVLGVMVVVVMAMMMVPSGCEHRACTHQQQNGDDDELLHAMKIARFRPVYMARKT